MLKTYPAAEQGALTPGERLHDLRLVLPGGGSMSLYGSQVFGWPVVLHDADSTEAAAAGCAGLRARAEEFARLECHVFAVTRAPEWDNGALAQRLGLPFPILSDADGALARALGEAGAGGPCTLVFDPILRLETIIAGPDADEQGDRALAWLKARAAAQPPVVVTAQAPVLCIPRVLEPEHCRRLIRFWEAGPKIEGAVASNDAGGNIVKRSTKVRGDVRIPDDSAECRDVLGALSRRLLPEVLKGIGYRVSRVETLRIGCYDSSDGGHFAAHRDNVTKMTEYRRYAMSLNLNTGEYEGGYLRFPEFGPQLYAPAVGGAVVFCCSLLHLATPVTRGRRFGLFSFFYGEEEEALRQRNNARSL